MSGALVDAHVHVHACFEPAAFFDSAAANFAAARRELELGTAGRGFLLLTESAGAAAFAALREHAAGAGPLALGGWSVEATEDPAALRLVGGDHRLIVVAGRQLVTAEGLEVLALATTATPADCLSLRDAIEAARDADAVAVVPWGFGKWWSARGRRVSEIVDEVEPGELWLGDNGNRPALAPRPALLARAESRGVRVLPGSDPLPFAAHASRAGSYGGWFPGEIDDVDPLGSLRKLLASAPRSPRPFGRLSSALSFVRWQATMQLTKRLGVGS